MIVLELEELISIVVSMLILLILRVLSVSMCKVLFGCFRLMLSMIGVLVGWCWSRIFLVVVSWVCWCLEIGL